MCTSMTVSFELGSPGLDPEHWIFFTSGEQRRIIPLDLCVKTLPEAAQEIVHLTWWKGALRVCIQFCVLCKMFFCQSTYGLVSPQHVFGHKGVLPQLQDLAFPFVWISWLSCWPISQAFRGLSGWQNKHLIHQPLPLIANLLWVYCDPIIQVLSEAIGQYRSRNQSHNIPLMASLQLDFVLLIRALWSQ